MDREGLFSGLTRSSAKPSVCGSIPRSLWMVLVFAGHTAAIAEQAPPRFTHQSTFSGSSDKIVWLSDSQQLLTAVDRQGVNVYEVNTGKRTLHHGLNRRTSVTEIALSTDERRLAIGGFNADVSIVDMRTGAVQKFTVPRVDLSYQDVAWNRDGSQLVFSHGSGVTVLAAPEYRPIQVYRASIGRIVACGFGPDESILYGGGDEQTVIWKVGTERPIHQLSGKVKSANSPFSHDKRFFVTTGSAKVYFWETDGFGLDRQFDGCDSVVRYLDWHPQKLLIVCATWDRDGFWRGFWPESWLGPRAQVVVWNFDSRTILFNTTRHSHKTTTAAWSPDGKLLVSSSGEGRVYLWDAFKGKLLQDFGHFPEYVNNVIWSPDGDKLAITYGSFSHTTQVWKFNR